VITTYRSPNSELAESWVVTKEIREPFAGGDSAVVVAASDWDLPPASNAHGEGYFARVDVSSEHQGKFYPPDYRANSGVADAEPVVIHWPDQKNAAAGTAKKRPR
jgi:hypothetical protein